jgi:murein DD-endopeptidase MepM/ murein hydrolase activator NlpD
MERRRLVLASCLLAAAIAAGIAIIVVSGRLEQQRPLADDASTQLEPLAEPDEPATDEPPVIVLGEPAAPPAPEITVAPLPPAIARLLIPVEGVTPDRLLDTWGDARGADRAHQGLDIHAPRGTPVLAADSGTVLKLFESEAGGIAIYQSDSTGDYVFYYAHMESRAPGLAEGDAVKAGHVIGYVGTSGNAAEDAPHLHFEIAIAPEDGAWYGGQPINPYDVLARRE